jgi:hypothetical protein
VVKKPVSTKTVTVRAPARRAWTRSIPRRILATSSRAATGSPRRKPSSNAACSTSSTDEAGWT